MHRLNGNVTTPLFKHLGSSSWHSWDAAIVKAFKHSSLFASAADEKAGKCAKLGLVPLLGIVVLMVVLLRYAVRVGRVRARGWGWMFGGGAGRRSGRFDGSEASSRSDAEEYEDSDRWRREKADLV